MPYPFPLPTTSQLSITSFLTSSTHPSLPLTASSSRAVVRSALKQHQRLSVSQRPSHLPEVHAALLAYLPFLSVLLTGLKNGGGSSNGAVVVVVVVATAGGEVEVQWSGSTLLSSSSSSALSTVPVPGMRDARRGRNRVKRRGLDAELGFVLHALAVVESGLARSALRVLYVGTTPTADQKDRALRVATGHLLQAGAIWTFLAGRQHQHQQQEGFEAEDLEPGVCGALAELALAEATLCAVRKDDPYPGLVTQERDKMDREWMYKAPEIPKIRALLDARLCLAAAEHAGKAVAGLGKSRDGVEKYVVDLRRVSRCKAARFFGMDAEMEGKTGEAVAWLRGGRVELSGGKKEDEGGRLRKLKKEWGEKREGRKVEGDGEWGLDAGKGEEERVLELLERKWVKMNDTVSQLHIHHR
jgi:hypothetical protein